jgi:hypothetical protein
MAAQAWPALGTTLAVDEASPPGGTYTLIGQVKSIKGAGGGEVGERDTSHLGSTVKTTAPTIPDNGECSFDINADPTDSVHKFLQGEKDAPPAAGFRNWKATFATAGTVSSKVFPGFVKQFEGLNADGVDDNLSASVTVRVTGAVTSVP